MTNNNCIKVKEFAIKLMNDAMTNEKLQDELRAKFEEVQDEKHWKNGTGYRHILNFEEAVKGYAALAWYHGGCEVAEGTGAAANKYAVYSKGYYEYCGA